MSFATGRPGGAGAAMNTTLGGASAAPSAAGALGGLGGASVLKRAEMPDPRPLQSGAWRSSAAERV
jgi:SMC interacting uncharacterized protein involved in chromosome segregation